MKTRVRYIVTYYMGRDAKLWPIFRIRPGMLMHVNSSRV